MNWIWNAVLGMLFVAGSNLLIKILQNKGVTDEQLMFYQSFMVCISSMILMSVNKIPLLPQNVNFGLLFLHGMFYIAINITILSAIKTAPNPSYPLTLVAANVVILLICSALFLNGEITMTKGFGVILVLAGVILITL